MLIVCVFWYWWSQFSRNPLKQRLKSIFSQHRYGRCHLASQAIVPGQENVDSWSVKIIIFPLKSIYFRFQPIFASRLPHRSGRARSRRPRPTRSIGIVYVFILYLFSFYLFRNITICINDSI
jgi:hypothetical protein